MQTDGNMTFNLTHGTWRFDGGTGREADKLGVVPLAFPLLAGPGATQ